MSPSADVLSGQLKELRAVADRDVPVINIHAGKPTAQNLEGYLHLGLEQLLVELPTEPREQTLRRLDELQAEFAKLA